MTLAIITMCDMTIRRVAPDVECSNMSETKDFYVEALGFEVGMDMDSLVTLVSPLNPTAQITLQTNASPQLTIEVEDVDAVHDAVQKRGAEIVYPLTDEDWGVRRFFVRDPNGLVVNVMTHNS